MSSCRNPGGEKKYYSTPPPPRRPRAQELSSPSCFCNSPNFCGHHTGHSAGESLIGVNTTEGAHIPVLCARSYLSLCGDTRCLSLPLLSLSRCLPF
ncbi:hypothetical protein GN956_G24676 [Arapaima gigas]